MKETLLKTFTKPGTCTRKELEEAREFLVDLQLKLDKYVYAYGVVPQGETLRCQLETNQWYLDRLDSMGKDPSED